MAEKRKMEVEIVAKDSTAKGTQSAEDNLDGVSAAAVGIATAAAAAAVALGTMVTVKSLEMWAVQEQAILQVEKRLESTGAAAWITSQQMQAMASSLQKTTTFGDETILQMESLLLTFKKINSPEMLERTTLSVLDLASALAQSTGGEPDLRSAATMVGKALNDPVLGLTAMSRAGIQFDDVQKDLIKTLVETGKQAEAQRIILVELESQFGGASGAVGLGGAVKQAQNAFGDLFEEFGEGLTATGELKEGMESLIDFMGAPSTLKAINDFGAAIGTEAGRVSTGKGLLAGIGRLATDFLVATNPLLSYIDIVQTLQGKANPFDAIKQSLIDVQDEAKKAQEIPILGALAGAQDLGGISADLGATGETIIPPSAFSLSLSGLTGAIAGEDGESPEAAALRKKTDDYLASLDEEAEALTESLLSRTELIELNAERELELYDELLANKKISDEEYSELKIKLQQDTESEMTAIAASAAADRQRTFIKSLSGIGDFADNIFSAIADSAEEGSKEEFEAQKKGQIASAIINTATGATKAFSQYGWPFGAIAAAAVVAAGAAQIGRIESQEWGSGGTVSSDVAAVDIDTTDTSSFTTDDTVTQPDTADPGAIAGTTYVITVQGNIVDQDQFARELIPSIEKAQQDGI